MKKLVILFLVMITTGLIFWSCSDDSNPAGTGTEKYIRLISPNGGETWHKGVTQTITWEDNISEDVRLDLYKSGVLHSNISNNVLSSGSYEWVVPITLIDGTDYRIRITSTADESLSGTSAGNLTISYPPIIEVNPTTLSFSNVVINLHYDQTLTLIGSNLTGNVTVTAPTGYQVSASSGTGFANSINFTPATGSVNSTVYVRFSPTAEQSYTGNISLTSTGATTVNAAVSGTGFNPPGEMVLIPAGTYMRGDHFNEGWSDELPVHQVTLSSFYMGSTEVTQGEWTAIMRSNPASGSGVGDNYPVYYVSWYSVIKFCNLKSTAAGFTSVYTINGSTDPADWGAVPTSGNDATWDAVICNWSANGYRLPTDAEWEYAARGGLEGQRFPNGATISHSTNGDTQANYFAQPATYSYDVSSTDGYHPDYGASSSPVGSFNANGYGLYDMSGNLWEWCWDWWHTYTTDAQVNPTGPDMPADLSVRVIRGGDLLNDTRFCRVANRDGASPNFSLSGALNIGFRLARTP